MTYLIGENQDYNSGHYNVTFSVGIPSASFSIPITDDEILEQDEMFTIGISLLPIDVIVGDVSETTVTIVNDDSKYGTKNTGTNQSMHTSTSDAYIQLHGCV